MRHGNLFRIGIRFKSYPQPKNAINVSITIIKMLGENITQNAKIKQNGEMTVCQLYYLYSIVFVSEILCIASNYFIA